MAHTKKSSQSGSGAPTTVTPEFVGQIYHDTTNGNSYIANGTGSGDWTKQYEDGYTHVHSLNNLSDVATGTPNDNDTLAYLGNSWGSEAANLFINIAIFIDERNEISDAGSPPYGGGTMTRTLNKQVFNNISGCELISHAIIGVNTAPNNTFTVSGDVQSDFDVGHYMTVKGSTGNDKGVGLYAPGDPYIIKSVSLDGDNDTVIEVKESVTDSTADGTIYTGRIKILPGTYFVTAEASTRSTAVCKTYFANISGFTYNNGLVDTEGSTRYWSIRSYTRDSGWPAYFQGVITVSSTSYWEIQFEYTDTTLGDQTSSDFDDFPNYARLQLIKI